MERGRVATFAVLAMLVTVTWLGAARPASGAPAEQAAYAVVFQEHGLPLGQNWSVDLGGHLLYSTGTSLAFTEPNGTYPLAIGPVPGYGVAKISGPRAPNQTLVNVSGSSHFAIKFGVIEPVIIQEMGLPFGSEWSATLAPAATHGGPASVASSSIVLDGGYLQKIAFDPNKDEAFAVTLYAPDSILVVNASSGSVVTQIALSGQVTDIAFDSGHGRLYVVGSLPHAGFVDVISDATNSIIDSLLLGGTATSVAYDSALGTVFVTNQTWGLGPSCLTVLNDTNDSEVQVVPLPALPENSTVDLGLGELFISTPSGILVLDASNASLVVTIPIPSVTGLMYQAGSGKVLATVSPNDSLPGYLKVIADANNSVVANVTVGIMPGGLGFDPVLNQVYVVNTYSLSLSVLSGSNYSNLTTVPVGVGPALPIYHKTPKFVVYDPVQQDVLVTWGDSIAVINRSIWQVTGNFSTNDYGPTGTTFRFQVPAGAIYRYSVTAGPSFKGAPSRGTIFVNTVGNYRFIKFRLLTEPVLFRQSGLPGGRAWTVVVLGGSAATTLLPITVTKLAGAGAIRVLLPLGNYTYRIESDQSALDPTPEQGAISIVAAPSPAQTISISFVPG